MLCPTYMDDCKRIRVAYYKQGSTWSKHFMTKEEIDSVRKEINLTWSGSGPGCSDPTADKLRGIALRLLRTIEDERAQKIVGAKRKE